MKNTRNYIDFNNLYVVIVVAVLHVIQKQQCRQCPSKSVLNALNILVRNVARQNFITDVSYLYFSLLPSTYSQKRLEQFRNYIRR